MSETLQFFFFFLNLLAVQAADAPYIEIAASRKVSPRSLQPAP